MTNLEGADELSLVIDSWSGKKKNRIRKRYFILVNKAVLEEWWVPFRRKTIRLRSFVLNRRSVKCTWSGNRYAYRLAQYSIQSIQLDLTLFLLFSSCATSIPFLCSQQDQGFALPALSHATERSLLIRSDTAKRNKMTHSGDGPSTYLGAVHSKRRTKKRLKKDWLLNNELVYRKN